MKPKQGQQIFQFLNNYFIIFFASNELGFAIHLSTINNKYKSIKTLPQILDYRYVYLMYNRKTGKTKIGISKNPEQRRSDIDRQIKGSVRIVFVGKFFFAGNVEKRLQDRFEKWHSPMKGNSSGKTEWFRFWYFRRLYVHLWVWWYWVCYWVGFWVFNLLLSTIVMFYFELCG